MMVEQVSGMSLSGPSVQFISVLGSRPNGKTLNLPISFVIFKSYLSDATIKE